MKSYTLAIVLIMMPFVFSLLAQADSLQATSPYPANETDVLNLIQRLKSSIYAPVIASWQSKAAQLTQAQIEKLWRMDRKLDWRQTDLASANSEPEKRIKILTQKNWAAFQWGGEDESADPSAPFVIDSNVLRPAGMPSGSYALSSGLKGRVYATTEAMLRNEEPILFEIEFQQVTRDGRIVIQQKTLSEADESLGWDGRFELQPLSQGGFEMVLTQGAMELPINLIGALPTAPLSPSVSQHNEFRSRHLFHLLAWQAAQKGNLPKLIVRDEGSILGFKPTTEKRYIQRDSNGMLLHAHGYGENFFPNPSVAEQPWIDESGSFWRVFDMVTQERTLEKKLRSGKTERWMIPTETRAVAAKMDKLNPSRRDMSTPFVFLTSNQIPGLSTPLPACIRYAFNTHGHAVEQRDVLEDGRVLVSKKHVAQNAPALLNEGLNFAEVSVQLGSHRYFLATNSGGEYTSGGLPRKDQKFYGTYLWYRTEEEGRIGPYHPVLTENGSDLQDQFRELTQMYGASWGIGRAQIFGKSQNSLWVKAHMIDVDLLPEDAVQYPQSGYPPSNAIFTNSYRRHQIEIPIIVKEVRGQPQLEVADPLIQADLIAWRLRQAKSIVK